MEVLHNPPSASSFTPLAEHQSRTPQSFYDGAPVLHYHSSRCKVVILESDLTASPALNNLRGTGSNTNGSSDTGAAQESNEEKEIMIEEVDVFVTSDKFLLYRSEANSGVALPYPLISLHAIQRLRLPGAPENTEEVQGLYMQIAKPTPADEMGAEEDEEEDSIILTIVPPPATEAASSALGSYSAGTETSALVIEDMATENGNDEPKAEETSTQALFAAVSACSNLHPDPVVHGDEGDGYDDDYEESTEQPGVGGMLQAAGLIIPGATDGGLPPPVDGSSGWITADNMHEYFDEEGNWIADGAPPGSMSLPGLGPGAGNVHNREDGDQAENGDGAEEKNEDGETKWQRTN